MAQITIDQAMQLALQHHQAGRLQQAEQLYRQILAQQPEHAAAIHHLGLVAYQVGRNDIAIDFIRRAIALKPDDADAQYNLGHALQDKGELDDAIVAYRQAIALRPNYAEAYTNLGNALREKGQVDEAIAAYRQAIALRSGYAEAYSNLGNALRDKGQLDQAIAACHQAIALKPNLAEAHSNLGNALRDRGQLDQGIAACRRAIALKPNLAEAHSTLGIALCDVRQIDEAIAACRQAIILKSNYAEAYNNLGIALHAAGQLDESLAAFRRAIVLTPDYAEACSNLGNALKDKGLLDEAIAVFRRAISLNPGLPLVHSNLLFALHYHEAYDARAIAQEHDRWSDHHAQPLARLIRPHGNTTDPNRRLRIGYVSPDFRDHAVGQNVLPLLQGHDHERFEVFCYANHLERPDDPLTSQFRACADTWRNIVALSDGQAAELVRADGIDILVDLALHTANNRLLVFARKPAPIQVTWSGYPGTTGLRTIDYRLTDRYLDPLLATDGPNPAELGDAVYSERSVRLPACWCCYRPRVETPNVNDLPALAAGHVTFGCLNNFCKVSKETLKCWCRLLWEVSGSRLLLHAHDGSHRQDVRNLFAAEGLDTERLVFAGLLPVPEYLRLYHQIDICLDPFPCSGGMTSCDALYMGVSVVSLCGRTAAGRGTATLLHNIGLPELVADSQEQYIRIAKELAGDLPRLGQLRSGLRQRMQASPLMDEPRFAWDVESAYREMWRAWCEGRGQPSTDD